MRGGFEEGLGGGREDWKDSEDWELDGGLVGTGGTGLVGLTAGRPDSWTAADSRTAGNAARQLDSWTDADSRTIGQPDSAAGRS